jgi:hypothetical protein
LGNGRADAARSAGDEDDFIRKVGLHSANSDDKLQHSRKASASLECFISCSNKSMTSEVQ